MRHPDNGKAERAQAIAQWPEELRADFEERAGILEHEGGLERSWAELEAFCMVSSVERRQAEATRLAAMTSAAWQAQRTQKGAGSG